MKEKKLEQCIEELKKPSQNRDQGIIIDYIKTLETFMNLIHEQVEDNVEVIKKISKIITYKKNNINDLIIQYGDKGNDFYIILKGTIGILVPKYFEYYMNEEDFIIHLIKLRKYNQNELIIQCLRQNSLIFSIPTEKFEELLNDINKKKLFSTRKSILKETKELYKYLKSEEYNNYCTKTINISPEEYISLLEVNETVKQNTERLMHLHKLKIPMDKQDEDKKLAKIPNYELVSKFTTGDTFGELALENLSKKRMATIITLSECDFAIINKIEYNELIKESVYKSKNRFFNLIYTYKLFDDIPHASFDRKYYSYFRHLKLKKNSVLFKEGDIVDEIYFILNGEYEIYVDKNIQEVNDIIIGLKYIADDLKKIMTKEVKNIIYYNSNRSQNKVYLKYKNNLNSYFSQFEKDIKLEEIACIINNRDLVNKKKFFGTEFDKIISEKKRIKLGIYKCRQIIGLNDIINRYNGNNICFFNCKCSSFVGELYHIKYNRFLTIYNTEENVKLYTCELLYQNLYYLIGRFLAHKKFIYEFANKKESEYMNMIFLEENNNNQNINNSSFYTTSENNKATPKNAISIITNVIKNKALVNKKNKININFIKREYKSLTNETKNDSSKKSLNLNILSHLNMIRNNESYHYESIDKKVKDNNDYYENNENNNSSNNKSLLESYILSKNNNKIKYNFNNSKSQKNINKNNKFNSRNKFKESPQNKITSKTKCDEAEMVNFENHYKYPVLIINDKRVEINEDSQRNNKNATYKNLLKSVDSKNKKLIDLIKSKELKNIAMFGDYSEKIEMKNKYKHLFRKKKNMFISRNTMKINRNNIQFAGSYNDKKINFNSTLYNNNNSSKFLTYSLSDLNGKNQKEIKLKINESKNFLANWNNNNMYRFNVHNNILYKSDKNINSLSYKKTYFDINDNNNKVPNNRNFYSTSKFNKKTFFKKKLFNNFRNKLTKNDNNIQEKSLPVLRDKIGKFTYYTPWIFTNSFDKSKK